MQTNIVFFWKYEVYPCTIVEVCKPRSKWDSETHRVQIVGGGIVRVRADQLIAA